jgi:acetyl-CoA carboxylase alpha subunit
MLDIDNLTNIDEFVTSIIDAAEQLIVDYVMTIIDEFISELNHAFAEDVAAQIVHNVADSLIVQLTELKRQAEKTMTKPA